ncbi:MAG: hypothetical protein KJ065_19325 [Anaerolineae bacterium]|nr:hypothetical protein [Anaerolineae bacterium]
MSSALYTEDGKVNSGAPAGRVGIGTQTPSLPLEIRTTADVYGLTIGDTSNSHLNIAGTARGPSGYGLIQTFVNGSSPGGALSLQRDGGNVGIGTSTPDHPLDVRAAAPTLSLFGTATKGEHSVGLSFRNAKVGEYFYIRQPYIGTTANVSITNRAAGGDLIFGTQDVDRVRISKDGNVGIGTGVPSERLHLRGTLKVDDGTNYGLIGHADSNFVFRSYDAATPEPIKLQQQVGPTTLDRLTVDSEGQVGIGTTEPRASLHVSKDLVLGGDGDNQKFIFHSRQQAQGDFLTIVPEDVASGGWAWKRGITLRRDGSVGIGTTEPRASLHVSKDLVLGGDGDNQKFIFHSRQQAQGDFLTIVPEDVASGGWAWKRGITLRRDGSVGIGTTEPRASLHVSKDLVLGGDGDNQKFIFHSRQQAQGDFLTIVPEDVASGGWAWKRGITLRRDGSVGIGTTEPRASLHVSKDLVLGGDGDNQKFIFHSRQHAQGDFLTIVPEDVASGGWAWERGITLRQDGNVGIGTTEPKATLHVKGNIRVTGDIALENADCAEEFTVANFDESTPGTVMVLTEGMTLRASGQTYDKRVVGIVSGAGDYRPGIILGKKLNHSNRMPIALMGKVVCKVDARAIPIEAGDLLTTSTLAGHAMKAVDPVKSFGAVLGKALSPLAGGIGLIPVLVALQ